MLRRTSHLQIHASSPGDTLHGSESPRKEPLRKYSPEGTRLDTHGVGRGGQHRYGYSRGVRNVSEDNCCGDWLPGQLPHRLSRATTTLLIAASLLLAPPVALSLELPDALNRLNNLSSTTWDLSRRANPWAERFSAQSPSSDAEQEPDPADRARDTWNALTSARAWVNPRAA
eukprot:CAMPEP_0118954734 /NCGR_PEP_ID=MMETSP1169-20130426/58778_1 /TAXON_ID=36882 /ORGANISM="Pyramimonas obovata, Strain CCMP722" /LENGTH=171 /DNA_ID=CAMNT_0006902417 /DNA_START=189 /DNA_END=701 /DNA_ORIENTATION=-